MADEEQEDKNEEAGDNFAFGVRLAEVRDGIRLYGVSNYHHVTNEHADGGQDETQRKSRYHVSGGCSPRFLSPADGAHTLPVVVVNPALRSGRHAEREALDPSERHHGQHSAFRNDAVIPEWKQHGQEPFDANRCQRYHGHYH